MKKYILILGLVLILGFFVNQTNVVNAQHDCDCCVGASNPSYNGACTATGSGYDYMSVDAGQRNHIYGGYTDEQCNAWCSGGGGGDNIGRCNTTKYYCPGSSCSVSCSDPATCASTCAPTSCTYISSVTAWSACINGMQYATDVTYATTTSGSSACVDVSMIKQCEGSCYSPNDPILPLSQTLGLNSSGLISYWPMNGNANDIKSGKNGTVLGAYKPTQITSSIFTGQAYHFGNETNTKESHIDINSPIVVKEASVSAWVKFDLPASNNNPNYGYGRRDWILGYCDDSNSACDGQDYDIFGMFRETNGKLKIISAYAKTNGAGSGIYCGYESDQVLPINTMMHIAGVYDPINPSNIKLYINGLPISVTGSCAGTVAQRDHSLTLYPSIGRFAYGNGTNNSGLPVTSYPNNVDFDFEGQIDDVAIWNRKLTDCEVKQLALGPNACNEACMVCYSPTDLAEPISELFGLNYSGLVSYWPFDGSATDIKSGYNGTLYNGIINSTGKFDRTYTFDGVDDYVEVPSNSALNVNSKNFTVAAWVKTNDTSNDFFVSKHDENLVNGYTLGSDSTGKVRWAIHSTTAHQYIDSVKNIKDGKWHFVAGTLNGDVQTVYIDGVAEGTRTYIGTPNVNNISLQIGKARYWNYISGVRADRYFNGIIDDVSIWNRSLTDCEIKQIALGPNACNEVCCYNPQDRFKLSSTLGTYTSLDGICKQYGDDWEFATISDVDELYIITGNNGQPIFNENFAIKNIPSNSSPFINNICSVEVSWPEPDKMAIFDFRYNEPMCYGDIPRDGNYKGLCKNINLDPAIISCDNNLTASCTATSGNNFIAPANITLTASSTGGTGPFKYDWSGTLINLSNSSLSEVTVPNVVAGVYNNKVKIIDTSDNASTTANCQKTLSNLIEIIPGITGGACGDEFNKTIPSSYPALTSLYPGLCAVNNTVSNFIFVSDPTNPKWTWDCVGNNSPVTTKSCSAFKATAALGIDCVVSMDPYSSKVNINADTSWTVSAKDGITSLTGKEKAWKLTDINNPTGKDLATTTSNTLNNIFTTIGLKTMSVSVSGGTPCTATTTVVQQGGTSGEI